jgi:hypothetical protein
MMKIGKLKAKMTMARPQRPPPPMTKIVDAIIDENH